MACRDANFGAIAGARPRKAPCRRPHGERATPTRPWTCALDASRVRSRQRRSLLAGVPFAQAHIVRVAANQRRDRDQNCDACALHTQIIVPAHAIRSPRAFDQRAQPRSVAAVRPCIDQRPRFAHRGRAIAELELRFHPQHQHFAREHAARPARLITIEFVQRFSRPSR